MSDNFTDFLLARTVDPEFDGRFNSVIQLNFKQRLRIVLQELEDLTGYRTLITSGYSTAGHVEGSKHYKGLAVDFVLLSEKNGKWVEKYPKPEMRAQMKFLCEKYKCLLLDEYKTPSNKASGPHFHLQYEGGTLGV